MVIILPVALQEDQFYPRSNQSFLQDHGGNVTSVHISRVNSDINLGNNNNNAPSNLSPLELSQVPSYAEAMNSDPPTITNEELFSPAYEPPLPGSHINLQDLNKNLTNLQQQNNNKLVVIIFKIQIRSNYNDLHRLLQEILHKIHHQCIQELYQVIIYHHYQDITLIIVIIIIILVQLHHHHQ